MDQARERYLLAQSQLWDERSAQAARELEEEERQNGRARFLAEVAAQRRQNAEEDGEAA